MKRIAPLCAALAALALAQSASAADRELSCKLDFTANQWSVVYQHGEGAGTVTCKDGTRMPVRIVAKGIGLTAGKWKIDHGTGRFSRVQKIDDVLGHYASLSGNVGLVKTGDVQVATKGRVSLALAGHGEGVNIGVAINEFDIEKAPAAAASKPMTTPKPKPAATPAKPKSDEHGD